MLQISKVVYPGLPSHPAHGRAQELFKQGFGGMLCFEVKGSIAATEAFMKALTLPLSAPRYGIVLGYTLNPRPDPPNQGFIDVLESCLQTLVKCSRPQLQTQTRCTIRVGGKPVSERSR